MIRLFLLTGLITFLMASCVITEDVTFAKNGTVNYQLAIDMSQLTKSGASSSSSMGEIPTEPISIAQLLEDSLTNLDILSAEHKQMLYDLAPLFLKAHSEDEDEQYTVKIYGEFKNVEHLNKALIALERSKEFKSYIEEGTENKTPEPEFSPIGKLSAFSWNGKQMQRIYAESNLPIMNKEENDEVDESEEDSLIDSMAKQMAEPMLQMLEMGQYITRYHFPKDIKSSNIESCEISEDKKTITITQVGLNFVEPEHQKIVVDVK